MRVLLAFDKFKEALTASAVCALAQEALRAQHADWSFDLCPLSDGGDGFAEILTASARGTLRPVRVCGPRGREVSAPLGIVSREKVLPAVAARLAPLAPKAEAATLAILDLASTSGLALLAPTERDPWHTTTRGTGELILAAAACHPAAILIGIGGSATNDLGLGALAALGLECCTDDGMTVTPPTPATWQSIAHLRGAAQSLPPLFIACDVTNPLLGPQGCAPTYGPQKGLAQGDLARLERASERLALLLCAHTQQPPTLMAAPGAGAAGGFAFGVMAGAGARLVPGFDLVADWLDLDRRLAAADLVITGEGRYDATSAAGKGPGAVVARARAAGRPVHVFAGSVATPQPQVHAISPADWPLDRAIAETRTQLRAALQRHFG